MEFVGKKIAQELKKAYDLENLEFYMIYDRFYCRYVSDPNLANDTIDILDMDFLLKSLSAQQGKVIFEDTGDTCCGIDELKTKYLVFRLAGL
jgi:hypothetical protein